MQKKYWLMIIFILVLATRLILAFSIPNFTYDSYYNLRHVEYVTENGFPLYQDGLSYGGREFAFLPFFNYFMSSFDLFLPLEFAAKFIPNLLLASLTIIVFFISRKITKNETASLFSALIVGFLPILYNTNSFSVESLFLPVVFLGIYSFLNIEKRFYLYLYLLTFLIASLTTPMTILILVGFLIYILLSFLESKKVKKAELELIIFSMFFFIWLQFLFFKDVFLNEGISFVWRNVPTQIIQLYFPKFTIIGSIILLSFIPLLAGIHTVYRSLFTVKRQKIFLLISFVLSTTLLAWLRLIEFKLALAFLGIILAILFASFYKEMANYASKIKFVWLKKYLNYIILPILLITMIIPLLDYSLQQETPSNEEIEAFQWLKENTPPDAGVASMLKEGHLVSYYGERKNIMDVNFNLIPNIEERFNNLNSLFTTKLQTHALDVFEKYDLDYIVVTPSAKEIYKIRRPPYTKGRCFEKFVYDNTTIYERKCEITDENEK
jgi:hypothetical protein